MNRSPAVILYFDNGGSAVAAGTLANPLRVDPMGTTTQPVSGQVTSSPQKSSTSVLSNVSASASSVTLLSANSNRLGFTIYNDSNNLLYVKFGTTASATSFTVRMRSQEYFECPFSYIGRVDGIWNGTNGAARITELTA